MPAMPRLSGKASKIAYKILGKPFNMQSKKTSRQEQVNKKLIFEETTRVR
jgi:hypothetical protein